MRVQRLALKVEVEVEYVNDMIYDSRGALLAYVKQMTSFIYSLPFSTQVHLLVAPHLVLRGSGEGIGYRSLL